MKQNRLSELRVILVDDYLGRASDTAASLEAVGCTVLAVIPTGAGILKQIADHEPDIIIIALDLESPPFPLHITMGDEEEHAHKKKSTLYKKRKSLLP